MKRDDIKMNENFRILIVDDELEHREVLQMILTGKGYKADTAINGNDALAKLKCTKYSLVLTDLIMDGMNGIELLDKIMEKKEDISVIIITGYGTVENAVEAMKKGAFSYFIKGHNPEELLIEIEKIKKIANLESDNEILRNQQYQLNFMLTTKNKAFRKILDIAEKSANSNANILILGESGVGKEVLAKFIHCHSDRKNGHFMAINCHAFSDNLIESELYGHEKGAFTGALDKRKGRIEESHKGTLFLDEIGDLQLNTQVKLLRTIETKNIERIGSNKSISVDFRLISATNKDLYRAILNNTFRDDLYYRISTITIELPPLRNRAEDLPLLIDFFVKKSEKDLKKEITTIEDGVMKFLLSYDYPGNIRELKNIIERLIVLSENGRISKMDLPELKGCYRQAELDEIRPLKDIRKELESEYIEKALDRYAHNITETARNLGLSRRQLFNKITEYKLK